MIFRIISFLIFLLITSSAIGSEIFMKNESGVYTLPVKINGVITLDFILDSGASEVCIPADVAMTLLRAHTIKKGDFLPGKSYSLADGSVVQSERFIIRVLELDGIRIINVPAMISSVKGDLLLGQSFLQRLDSWTIDNQRHALIVGGSRKAKSVEVNQNPPIASSVTTSISKKEVYDLIQDFFRSAANHDINNIMNHYADKVDYYGKLAVDKRILRKDKENYFKKWSIILYKLDGEVEIQNTNEPNTVIANFTMDFYVSNPNKISQGKVINVMKFSKINGQLEIVVENQRLISRKITNK